MMNNSMNNNGTNNNGGRFTMVNGSIQTIELFATTVQSAVEAYYGDDVKAEIHNVTKNNGLKLTGITIKDKSCNTAPTIYLEGFYMEYQNGRDMASICQKIFKLYEDNRLIEDFDTTCITEFECAKTKVCFKLVNAEKNKDLLQNAPHLTIHDLAIIFYVMVSGELDGIGSVTVTNHIQEMWGVDTDTLFTLARTNSQRLLKGQVQSMMNVMMDIVAEHADEVDEELIDTVFDIYVEEEGAVSPMYVASNRNKVNGASVILYSGLLKGFADKINDSFYILPSSVHEVLFIPASTGPDAEYLKEMVYDVNRTQVAEDEILSDHIYYYDREADYVEML